LNTAPTAIASFRASTLTPASNTAFACLEVNSGGPQRHVFKEFQRDLETF